MKKLSIIILSLVVLNSCYKEEDFSPEAINPDDIILSVTSNKLLLLANAADEVIIEVKLPLDADDDLSTVTFKTDQGTFANSTQSVSEPAKIVIDDKGNKSRVAKVTLTTSQRVGVATVTVSVKEFVKTITIEFERNFANSIDVRPAKLSIPATLTDELEIVLQLSSTNGKVSNGQTASLKALDTLGNAIGRFRVENSSSNVSQQASYIFTTAPDTAYTGRLLLVGEALGGSIVLKDTTIIYAY